MKKLNVKHNKKVDDIIKHRIRNTGLWWSDTGQRIHWFAKFCIFCFTITNLTQCIELVISFEDLKELFACFSILSFCGMGFLKLHSLKNRREEWINLINKSSELENNELNNHDDFDMDSDDEDIAMNNFNNHIDLYTKRFKLTSTVLYRIYSFTAIVFILAPFIEYGIYVYQGKTIDGLPHILPGWSPLDSSFVGYCFTIFIEVIAAAYCVAVHVAFDIAVVGIMIFVCGQFTLLHKYSEDIGGKGKSCNFSEKRDFRAHCRIAKCHKIHVVLLRSVNELGKLIQTILGIYFTLATLTLCSVAVQFTWEELSTTQLICLLQYMCATLTQLYLYCHFGDSVLNESYVGLGEGPFCAAYWCLSPKIRREIAGLCVGMSRQRRLNAGFMHSLDLPSFINEGKQADGFPVGKKFTPPRDTKAVNGALPTGGWDVRPRAKVVRTAYSYYAVLRGTSD